jgi:hypothetical protein
MSDNAENGADNASSPAKPAHHFDFAEHDVTANAQRGAKLVLLNPRNGLPTGVTFLLYGVDARGYRTNLRRMRDEVAASPEKEPTDADDAMLLGRARDSACAVISWEGVYVEGQEITCNFENAVKLFQTYTWAADQVLNFIAYRGNY